MLGFMILLFGPEEIRYRIAEICFIAAKFQQGELASYWRGVYRRLQDDFCLQPFWVYRPLLALLLEPGRGVGGVASSETLAAVQLNRHPHEPRPQRLRLFRFRPALLDFV